MHLRRCLTIFMMNLVTVFTPVVAMASIGSTGGGHSSGHSFLWHDTNGSGDNTFLIVGAVLILIVIIGHGSSAQRDWDEVVPEKSHKLLPGELTARVKQVKQLGNRSAAKTVTKIPQNMTVKEFAVRFPKLQTSSESLPVNLVEQFGELYAKAQFTYSEQLRRYLAGNSIDRKSLGRYFFPVLQLYVIDEIKRKAVVQSLDDTVVSHTKIMHAERFGGDDKIWIVELSVVGFDNEYTVNRGFSSTFKRVRWTDKVIFAQDVNGEWRMVNLCYGGHFHLNGKAIDQ